MKFSPASHFGEFIESDKFTKINFTDSNQQLQKTPIKSQIFFQFNWCQIFGAPNGKYLQQNQALHINRPLFKSNRSRIKFFLLHTALTTKLTISQSNSE